MTHPIRIALQPHPQHTDYTQIHGTVAEAEAAAADIVFNRDHFIPPRRRARRQALRVLDAHCAGIGRDPKEIERSIGVQNSPDDVAGTLVAAGATLFTIGAGGPRHDLGLLKEWIAWRDARRS